MTIRPARPRARLAAAVVLSTVLVAVGGHSASAHAGHGGHGGHGGHAPDSVTLAPTEVAGLRAATAAFHDPARAILAGYVPTEHCEPGMGQHWVNVAYLGDGVHDITRPDILLYEPKPSGHRLVGAEWLQFDADQDLTTDDDRPSLAGVPFDGPMLGHEPGMPVHYDIHVYAWSSGPGSLTSTHNPRVEC